jgi:hypothetical protein
MKPTPATKTSPAGQPPPANKKPYHKPTNHEAEERIEFVAGLIVQQKRRMEIHRGVIKRWGVHWRTADRYLVHARRYLQKQAQMTSNEAKAVGVNVLLSVFREGKPGERVAAERRWSEIFGYSAPTTIRDSRQPGDSISISGQPASAPPIHVIVTGAVAPQGKQPQTLPAEPAAGSNRT